LAVLTLNNLNWTSKKVSISIGKKKKQANERQSNSNEEAKLLATLLHTSPNYST
jgi:hypothetical protein